MTSRLNFSARSFDTVRSELTGLVRQYYPELSGDITDSTVLSLLIDLNAAICSQLSLHNDRLFQETQLDSARERKSILAIAKNLGFRVPGKRPAMTVVDFSVRVPVRGDTFDAGYLPVLRPGTQVMGGGRTFELLHPSDFASPVSNLLTPNRTVIPTVDSNGTLSFYTITKREVVIAGQTRIYPSYVREAKPFTQIVLPDADVLSVEQVIGIAGLSPQTPASAMFYDPSLSFHEVDYLMQREVLLEGPEPRPAGGLVAARWQPAKRRFTTEYTDRGFLKLTFGGGNGDLDVLERNLSGMALPGSYTEYLANTSLGQMPAGNTTLFIRYRVGGGASSNIGPNSLTTTGLVDMALAGPNEDVNRSVRNSLRVNNPFPALGGTDQPSVEQIRRQISYNFRAQDRCIDIDDYRSRVLKMPGRFGAPFQCNALQKDNKIVISLLSLDASGRLSSQSPPALKENIAEYLSRFRAVNDYVTVTDGRIFNIALDLELMVDETDERVIASAGINEVIDYFSVHNRSMNQEVYLGELAERINNIPGVLNVISYRVFAKTGGEYSANESGMPYLDTATREIRPINNTLYSEPDAMYEIRNPRTDIRVFTRRRNQLR